MNHRSSPFRTASSVALASLFALTAGCAAKPATSAATSTETSAAQAAATEKSAAAAATGQGQAVAATPTPVAPALDLPNVHLGDGLLSAGQPTLEQLKQAKALGYRAVINLRTPEEPGVEKAADVEALGLTYVSIPVAHEAGVTEENARALAAALASPANLPAIVHCGSANRVGALYALKAFYVDGKSATEALALGKGLGLTKLEAFVAQKLAKAEAERAAKK